MASVTMPAQARVAKPFYHLLYVQVLIAIVLGVIAGALFPGFATNDWVKFLGEAFVKLIKMMIAPIIFCTIVSGIAHVQDARKVGRVGIKALVYFEVVSTFALALGMIVGNVLQPGAGFQGKADAAAVAKYATQAGNQRGVDFVLNIIPDTIAGAFANSETGILQVLLISLLFGFALQALGERGRGIGRGIDALGHAVFAVIGLIMKLAPIGAFGAMAYTIGKFGTGAIVNLLFLIGTFYLTAALFILVVLGLIARLAGFSIFRFIAYIRAELLIVLGTSSSESALPLLMAKLEKLGCAPSVVGLVVPTGYSFNLDGTNIYMTLASLFVAQAAGIELSFTAQISLLLFAMATSKGASGVSGSGFIVLAATLGFVNPALVPWMATVLGIDKFMSECRALTNIIGNGVATIVVAAWEGELDRGKLNAELASKGEPENLDIIPAE